MYRLGHCIDGEWQQISHPAIFKMLPTSEGADKLIATAPGSDCLIFRELANLLNAPLHLLYVLHTPRGEGVAGRYQSSEIDHACISNLLERFDVLFRTDGRYDLWVSSPSDSATIVWDRHDLVHVYGVVEQAEIRLRQLGFVPGSPTIDFVHEHHYRSENDQLAGKLLAFLDWKLSPLRPEDEQ